VGAGRAVLMTSTDVTIEHYLRPEVKAVIMHYCQGEHGVRALNADEHWYRGGKDPKTVMLRGPADYEDTITGGRTLYATLDIFDPAVFEQSETWNDKLNAPEKPIGDLSSCLAFTLSTDIDGIGDIRSLSVKEAVESAAQFHVDYLREMGIEKNVHCLYSGGGIYVHLHHGLFAVDVGNTDLTSEEIKHQYQVITKAYNRLIGDISQAFFRKYPQHIGRVKFDQLNNQKRTFKTVFSLHKRLPFAVIPLNPKAIMIDFARASLPLSDAVLAEGAAWCTTFDPSEKEAIVTLLKPKMEEVEQIIRDRPTEGNNTISRLPEPLDQAKFAPCMQNIIANAQAIEGRHRALGILATYLYQMGWNEDAAFDLWAGIADRCGVEPRIFDTEFGRVSCPLCATIQKDTGGYPNLNLFNLEFCVPDAHCRGCQWPGDYHNQKILDEGQPKGPDSLRRKDICNIDYNDKGEEKSCSLSPSRAAYAIMKAMPLAMSKDDDSIFYFSNDIYKQDGVRVIDKSMCDVAGDAVTGDKLKETLRRIRNDLLETPVTFDPDPWVIGVKNGVADLLTGKVREYHSEDLITDQIDVTYESSAKCPVFLDFLESITPNVSDRITLIDWFVATAIKEPLAYVLFLLGLGRNGKGIYEKLIKKFFGQSAFRDMPLAEVSRNNFAASGFYKKRGWIASETGKRKAAIGTDFMKLTSGNGVIDGDRKNQSRIQFEPYFQTIVDTNTMPQIEDSSIGWMERFVKVDLPYIFIANPGKTNTLEKQRDPCLFGKLSTPGELSGILNLLLFRSQAIGKSKAIHKRSGSEMFAEYAEQSSSVKAFLDAFCEYDGALSGLRTPSEPIYAAYKEWCGYKVGEVVDKAYFGKQLKKFCGGVEPKRGKDKETRKSTTTYQGLIYDSSKCEAALDALRLSMSQDVSGMSQGNLKEGEDIQGQKITMSQVSQGKLWNEIMEKFGNPQKEDKSSPKREKANLPETLAPPETSTASNGVGGKLPRDILETLPETKSGIGPHPRRDEPTPTKRVCAKCGADLTGHATVERGGKVYCAQPGCGYPEREKAEAS